MAKFRKIHRYIGASALAGTILLTGLVTSTNAQTQYRGRACIETVNGWCPIIGWNKNNCAVARFSPENAPGNTETRLSLFWSTYAQNFIGESVTLIGGAYKDVRYGAIGNWGGEAVDTRTKMRVPVVQPVNYSQAWLHSVIDIFRFDDWGPGSGSESLCNVRIRFTGMKHPPESNSTVTAPSVEGLGNSDAEGLGN